MSLSFIPQNILGTIDYVSSKNYYIILIIVTKRKQHRNNVFELFYFFENVEKVFSWNVW